MISSTEISSSPTPWQAASKVPNQLGESPFWHQAEQTLYWVDIPQRQILRANVYMGTVETWNMPSEPGCIAPAASGGLVIALRHGVFRARQWGGVLEHIATLDYDPAHMRANDGKCDALGRLWIGTLDETKKARNAALYMLDARAPGKALVVRMTDPATLPATTGNGLAWSPDGATLYWADTGSQAIWAWDFDAASARLSNRRLFHQFAPKSELNPEAYAGRPDGAAVDALGNYHVAMYEGARVCQLSPDGKLLAQWRTPAQCPTMPCFGGDDQQTLYLTTARQKRSATELEALPLSGCILSMRAAVPGLPVNFFLD
jgi:sugar lactone lactonase YvrE